MQPIYILFQWGNGGFWTKTKQFRKLVTKQKLYYLWDKEILNFIGDFVPSRKTLCLQNWKQDDKQENISNGLERNQVLSKIPSNTVLLLDLKYLHQQLILFFASFMQKEKQYL